MMAIAKAWVLVCVAMVFIMSALALGGCAAVKCVRNTYECGFN